jgi:hypothetical protein
MFYSLRNIIKVIKPRRIRYVARVTHVGDDKRVKNVWSENLKGSDRFEDLRVDGRTI